MSRKKSSDPDRVPMRRCIGCMESRPKGELIRIALYNDELTLDPQGAAMGRGVYLCRKQECIDAARKKKGLNRGFRRNFSQEAMESIFGELENAEQ